MTSLLGSGVKVAKGKVVNSAVKVQLTGLLMMGWTGIQSTTVILEPKLARFKALFSDQMGRKKLRGTQETFYQIIVDMKPQHSRDGTYLMLLISNYN